VSETSTQSPPADTSVEPTRPYTPPAGITQDQAKANDVAAFERASALMGDDGEEGDGLTTYSKPEKIWEEGRKSAEAKAEQKKAADRVRGADGKFAPASKAPEPEPGSKSTVPDEEHAEMEVERARLALIRSGFKAKEIDAMAHEDMLKRGLKRAKALEADDEAHGLVRGLKKPAADTAKTESGGEPAKAQASKPLDVSAMVTPLARELGLDEAGASTLKQSYEQLAEALTKHTEEQVRARLDGVTQAQDAVRTHQVFADAQVEVGERFPDLLDPSKFDLGIAFALSLMKEASEHPEHPVNQQLQRYATPKERAAHLLEAYAYAAGYEAQETGDESEDRRERKLRSHARSTVSDRSRPAPTTQHERDRAVFYDVMAKHGIL
jgi:hypothetical protein